MQWWAARAQTKCAFVSAQWPHENTETAGGPLDWAARTVFIQFSILDPHFSILISHLASIQRPNTVAPVTAVISHSRPLVARARGACWRRCCWPALANLRPNRQLGDPSCRTL